MLSGVQGGNHQVAGLPLPPNRYFGVEGANLCIGVVVVCPSQAVAFHFTTTDDAGATIRQYSWPTNCKAVICGGCNSPASNDLLIEVINSLKQSGIKIDGMVNTTGCFYGPGGMWYVGVGTLPSQDTPNE